MLVSMNKVCSSPIPRVMGGWWVGGWWERGGLGLGDTVRLTSIDHPQIGGAY
jgi:hypothetical protein